MRICPQSEPEEDRKGDETEAETGHLGTGKESEVFLRVVAAQVFEREAHEAVKHDVEGEALPACVSACAEDEQQGKDDDVELPLPDLRRPERLRTVGVVREGGVGVEDAVAAARRCTEGIPVEEVCAAAECLSEDNRRCGNVHKVDGVELVFSAVEDADEHTEKDTALDRHAALPDVQNLGQVVLVVVPVEEEHVPEPRAEESRDAAVDAEIGNVLLIAASVRLCEEVADTRREQDGEGDDDTVRADGEVSDVEEILMQGSLPILSTLPQRAAATRGR